MRKISLLLLPILMLTGCNQRATTPYDKTFHYVGFYSDVNNNDIYQNGLTVNGWLEYYDKIDWDHNNTKYSFNNALYTYPALAKQSKSDLIAFMGENTKTTFDDFYKDYVVKVDSKESRKVTIAGTPFLMNDLSGNDRCFDLYIIGSYQIGYLEFGYRGNEIRYINNSVIIPGYEKHAIRPVTYNFQLKEEVETSTGKYNSFYINFYVAFSSQEVEA